MSGTALLEPDAVALADAVRTGRSPASELCETALERAATAPGIFWSIDADRARADAAAIDADRADGRALGPLAGVPIAVKDSYAVAGVAATLGLGTPLADGGCADRDAEAVARLRGAGATVIGTTAMDQLAWSMNGTAPDRPPLENPAAPGHVTGGSSGGSAAAVAAGIVPVALGSDSAGSVRLPAAWCGVLGLKPTHGLVSLRGVAPMAPSLDTAGILARSVRDLTAVLQVLAGVDDPGPVPPPRCAVLTDGIGWFDTVVDTLAGTDWQLVQRLRELPAPRLGRILAAELADSWGDRLTPAQVSADVWAGIERGRGLDAAAVHQDRDALALAERDARRLFDEVSVLITPSVPYPAPPLGHEVSIADATRYTRTLSAFGWPCVSLPCGTIDGGPVAIQLAAAPGADASLLVWAQQLVAVLHPGAKDA
jgi:Asp-tRNA(Asn)/Glu-tRNA(Gln) amidotransferase A subunit family amidase